MSISPTSDILLDMARAADPARARAAIARLEAGSDAGVFKDALAATSTATGLASPGSPVPSASSPVHAGAKLSPYGELEAFFLQQFLEDVLPKAEDLYGGGAGAGNWRSLMAEQMARSMVRAGGIGLAARLQSAEQSRLSAKPGAKG